MSISYEHNKPSSCELPDLMVNPHVNTLAVGNALCGTLEVAMLFVVGIDVVSVWYWAGTGVVLPFLTSWMMPLSPTYNFGGGLQSQ